MLLNTRFISAVAILTCLFSQSAEAIEAEITGVENDALKQNIAAHLGIISIPGQCLPFTDFTDAMTEKISEAARAEGFYNVEVISMQPASEKECGKWLISLKQGQPTLISDISVALTGDGSNDPALMKAINGFELEKGKRLRHSAYERSKRKLLNTALEHGYLDFAYAKKQLMIDRSDNSANVLLEGETGQAYAFGEIEYDNPDVPFAVLRSLVPFETGQQFTATKLNKFNENLRKTGYFENVIARPVMARSDGFRIPIEIVAVAKPKDTISVGGGVSSDTGPRIKLNWQRPWFTEGGHSISASAFISNPIQSLSVNYKIPLDNPLTNYISLQAGLKREKLNDTDSRKHTVAVQHHQQWDTSDWKWIKFIRYDEETFIQGEQPEQTTRLTIPGLTFQRLRSRGGLDIHWGDKQLLTVEGAQQAWLSDIDYRSVHMQSKWIRSYDNHRLMMRVELGALAASDEAQVPSSLRFFAGGDQSIRGFGYEELAPVDENDKLVGGKYLYTASAEYSYPVADTWRAAVFFDAGNAADKFMQDYATGFGAGAIWQSPVGPIRLYVARGNSDIENTWRFHFAMGPAL